MNPQPGDTVLRVESETQRVVVAIAAFARHTAIDLLPSQVMTITG